MVVLSKVRSIGVNKVFVDDQINNVNRETERLNKQSWEAEVVVTPPTPLPFFLQELYSLCLSHCRTIFSLTCVRQSVHRNK